MRNACFLGLMILMLPAILAGAIFALCAWGFSLGRSATAAACRWVLS